MVVIHQAAEVEHIRIVALAVQAVQHGDEAASQAGKNDVRIPPHLHIVPAQAGEVSLCQLNTKIFTNARGGQQVFSRPPPASALCRKKPHEYYIIEFPDGTHALALFDRGLAADLAKGKAVTLPISARAGVNTYAKPYLQDICAEYGADLENVVYAFDDGWYKEHSGQILLIRLGVTAGVIVAVAVLWAFVEGLLKRKRTRRT